MTRLTVHWPFSYDDFDAPGTATTWGFDTIPTLYAFWAAAGGGGPVLKEGADTATGSDSATVLAAPDGSDLGEAGDTVGVGVFATASDAATGGDEATLTALLVGEDTATGADASSVLAIADGSDTGTGSDDASVLVQAGPDDPASADELGQISAAGSADDLGPVSDDISISVSATAGDDALAIEDATVEVKVFVDAADDAFAADDATVEMRVEINAADEAFATDEASVEESIPDITQPTPLGTGLRRRRADGRADLKEGALALDQAAVAASLRVGDRVEVWDIAGVTRWPDPAYANPVILAMMMAALDDA